MEDLAEMKDWHFKIPTAVGGLLALVVLWGQFGHTLGLPSWNAATPRTVDQRQHEFQWQKVLEAGKTIEIKGINGSVLAEKGVRFPRPDRGHQGRQAKRPP